ncbi:MAG: DUF433 domain-containing protein [Acidimicrobiales bacterium]
MSAPAAHDLRFAVPLYTVAEAARALDVPATTFATWVKGYVRHPVGRSEVRGAPVVTALPAAPGEASVPFVGLAEGLVLAAIRRAGVPLQRVRPALAVLQRELGVEHALASRRLYTDGAEVLFDYGVSSAVDAGFVAQLVVVRNGQRVFAAVVASYLQRVDYDPADGFAALIRLPAYAGEVVCDPRRSFGRPIFLRGGARVDDVLARFQTGESLDELSGEFGVPLADLEDALRAASRRAA